jgi:hypothetical protein
MALKEATVNNTKSIAIFDRNMQTLVEELCKHYQFDPYVGEGKGIKITCPLQSIMPFHIDSLLPDLVAVSHTYILMGDMMRDPEITYLIVPGPNQTKLWIPAQYRQDNLGIRQELAKNEKGKIYYNQDAIEDLLTFTESWVENIRGYQFMDGSVERFDD